MGKAITLGVVLGAKLAPGFGAVFKTAKEQAQGLKTTLANAKLGASVSSDVARLGARLERLKASQTTLGTGNVKLAARIAQTQRELNRASATASRYGVSMDNAAAKNRRFAATADQAARSLTRLRAAEQRKAVRDEAKGQMLGTAGAALAAGAPVKEAMDFEHRLRSIGNIADLSGKQVSELGQSVQRTGVDVNQTSDAMLDAYNVLLGKGMNTGQATALLGIIGKTATGEQANIEDLSVTTFALVDNLKLAESEIPKAMDMLAQAGKEGSFELKDMAKYFPQLTAQVATLGMKGPESVATLGAALQVAMKGAGSPEEAANNFKNFLQKMTAPDTLKNFEEAFGVNLEKSMKTAMKRGENPVEYMVGLISKLTKGDKFRVGELFGDMQVGNFLAPMMQHLEEYRNIKAKSLGASGVVDRDFANMMATGTERVKHAGIELKRLGVNLGTTLLPAVGFAADKLGAMLSTVTDLAQRYPSLTTAVTIAAIGLVGFKVASLAARIGGTLLLDGVSLLGAAFNFFRPSVLAANVAMVWHKTTALASAAAHAVWQGALLVGRGVMLGFAGVMKVVTAAQWLWNVALTANPIGLVIAAVAALGVGAYMLYEHWEPVKTFFQDLWTSIAGWCGSAMAEVKALVSGPLDYLEGKTKKLLGWLGIGGKGETEPAQEKAVAALGQTVSAHGNPQGAEKAVAALGQTVSAHGNPQASQATQAVQQLGQTVPSPAAKPKATSVAGMTADKAQALLGDPKWQSPAAQAILKKHIAMGGGQPATATPSPKAIQAASPALASAASPISPAASSAAPASASPKSGSAGGGQVVNTFSITGVGVDHVAQMIKQATEAFSRELESKIAALRDQQMRLSYGG